MLVINHRVELVGEEYFSRFGPADPKMFADSSGFNFPVFQFPVFFVYDRAGDSHFPTMFNAEAYCLPELASLVNPV